MAPSAKPTTGGNQANHPATNPQPSNGVLENDPAPAGSTVNRKKQKRREKQAARQAAASEKQTGGGYEPDDFEDSGLPAPHEYANSPRQPPATAHNNYADPYFAGSEQYEGVDEDIAYSDEEGHYTYDAVFPTANGIASEYVVDTGQAAGRSSRKKKSRSSENDMVYDSSSYNPSSHYHPSEYTYPSRSYASQAPHPRSANPPPAISDEALRTVQRGITKDPIWDTSSHEEKLKIKEFWLSLGEQERKSLVKIEKEAVLRKMKEQQKTSCSCTVCGRKRTAIEEELEILYDAYYRELEQEKSRRPIETPHRLPPRNVPRARHLQKPTNSRIQELPDDEEEEEELGEEDFSDGDYDEDDYSGDELEMHDPAGDFLAFGNSLTVQGGILTVAEELLKNDGQKFIDMMEQLAERRLQREEEAHRMPWLSRHGGVPSQHYANHSSVPPEDEEYDDEEDEDYDSQDGYDEEEEDEMDQMTEKQRMEEGRRMFQIFAARMFEQRVVTAYREKVARERQNKLIEELEAEQGAASQRDAKKARDAEKKKAKKQQQKQIKAEEKARKEQQKAAEEAAAKEAEVKKQEEQKRKREEQRKKREAERRAQEEEKLRKEAEKLRRQQEERERQQEAERKAREHKAEEKKRREEARRKERVEREAKEQAAREKKTQDEQARKAQEEKARAEQQAQERKRSDAETPRAPQASPAPETTKKVPSMPPTVVALPPLKSQKSSASQPSPSKATTNPAVPKAPTPVRARDTSGQTSQSSAPDTPEVAPSSKQSTPPKALAAQPSSTQPSAGPARAPGRQQARSQAPPVSPLHPVAPPPGMPHPQGLPYAGVSPGMVNGFPRGPGPMMQGLHQGMHPGRQVAAFNHGHHMSLPSQPNPNMPLGGPPSAMMLGRGHTPDTAAVGFPHNSNASLAGYNTQAHPPPQTSRAPHSRQPSSSFELPQPDSQAGSASTQPIARPQPIKRPSSARPQEGVKNKPVPVNTDLDTITKGLGSSALLDDSDEPLPSNTENRRPSGAPTMPPPNTFGSPFEQNAPHFSGTPSRNAPTGNWGPSTSFAQSTFPTNNPGWGAPSTPGWTNPGGFNGARTRSNHARPVTVRLLVCQAYQRLCSMKGTSNGVFQSANEVLHQIEAIKPYGEPMVQTRELYEILDTEGDSHNGGGSFSLATPQPNQYLIKWDPESSRVPPMRGSAPGIGQIGGSFPGALTRRDF